MTTCAGDLYGLISSSGSGILARKNSCKKISTVFENGKSISKRFLSSITRVRLKTINPETAQSISGLQLCAVIYSGIDRVRLMK